MENYLDRIPKWALVGIIFVLFAILVPVSTFSISQHLEEDAQQSADIRALTRNVDKLAVTVESLARQITFNREDIKENRSLVQR